MTTASNNAFRQRLGRRLGLAPYYRLEPHPTADVHLVSQAQANRGPGITRLVLGITLLLLGLIMIINGSLARIGSGDFALAAVSAVIGAIAASWGFQTAAGGWAILTTKNRILVDSEGVRYVQSNRLMREQQQLLARNQISGIRLRRRPLVVGGLIKRVRPIVVLELITGADSWIIDSAMQAEELRAGAEAIAAALGLELTGNTTG